MHLAEVTQLVVVTGEQVSRRLFVADFKPPVTGAF